MRLRSHIGSLVDRIEIFTSVDPDSVYLQLLQRRLQQVNKTKEEKENLSAIILKKQEELKKQGSAILKARQYKIHFKAGGSVFVNLDNPYASGMWFDPKSANGEGSKNAPCITDSRSLHGELLHDSIKKFKKKRRQKLKAK